MQNCRELLGWGVWYERTTIEGCQHGLQVGEVSMSCRDDQGCVKELAIQLLCFKEVMCSLGLPGHNCCKVLDLLLLKEMDDACAQVPPEAQVGNLKTKQNCL